MHNYQLAFFPHSNVQAHFCPKCTTVAKNCRKKKKKKKKSKSFKTGTLRAKQMLTCSKGRPWLEQVYISLAKKLPVLKDLFLPRPIIFSHPPKCLG